MNGSSGSRVREYPRAWAEMVPDVLGLIFNMLSLEEKVLVIPMVCKPWRDAARGPYCWREKMEKIDMDGLVTRRLLRLLITRNAACYNPNWIVGDAGDKMNPRAWAEMAPDVLALIFNRLSLLEKLQVVPMVCKPWRNVAEGPSCWEKMEKIHIDGFIPRDKQHKKKMLHLKLKLLRVLVTASSGSFKEIYVSGVGDPHLSFIAHHARSLRVLLVKSSSITDSMVEQVAPKFSSLTAIDLSHCCAITARSLAAIGTNCRSLESLTWDVRTLWCPRCWFVDSPCHNDMGQAIARTMPKLKRLSIAYSNIHNEVAHQILSGCPALEWFNVKGCDFETSELEDKHPKIKVVHVHHEDPGDGDNQWDSVPCVWCKGYMIGRHKKFNFFST